VHPQAVLLEVPRLEAPAREVRELRVRRAVDVDRILLPDDGGSSARPMTARSTSRNPSAAPKKDQERESAGSLARFILIDGSPPAAPSGEGVASA